MTELYDLISLSILGIALTLLTVHQRLARRERERRIQQALQRVKL